MTIQKCIYSCRDGGKSLPGTQIQTEHGRECTRIVTSQGQCVCKEIARDDLNIPKSAAECDYT